MTTTREDLTDQLPGWMRTRPGWDQSPITIGSSLDTTDRHLWIVGVLESLGWSIVWHDWVVPAEWHPSAGHPARPHPQAGQTLRWAKCHPPGYNRLTDPQLAVHHRKGN